MNVKTPTSLSEGETLRESSRQTFCCEETSNVTELSSSVAKLSSCSCRQRTVSFNTTVSATAHQQTATTACNAWCGVDMTYRPTRKYNATTQFNANNPAVLAILAITTL